MNRPQPTYRAYLIRFRYAANGGRPVWRAALQEPGSDAQILFANLGELWAFLTAQLGLTAEEDPQLREDQGTGPGQPSG